MTSKQDYDQHRLTTLNGRKNFGVWNCESCKKDIEGKNCPAIIAEIETSIFRGDDIVHAYHPKCWTALPNRPAETK